MAKKSEKMPSVSEKLAEMNGKCVAADSCHGEMKGQSVAREAPKSVLRAVGSTRLTVIFDVGFGSRIFIRGQGGELSWEKGIPLKNVAPNRWTWETFSLEPIAFKLLINDGDWELGENHTLIPGAAGEILPQF